MMVMAGYYFLKYGLLPLLAVALWVESRKEDSFLRMNPGEED